MFERLKDIITHTKQVDKEILDLLENATIGTNGAKYKHLHTSKKIHQLHKPHFFTLRKNNKAIGNMTVCERPMFVKGKQIDSFYIRYFSFSKFFQSNGENPRKTKVSTFQQYVNSLFSSAQLNPDIIDKKPSMFWAFIDPQNNRSWQMAERFKFENIGLFSTFGFSRFFPKHNSNVSKIDASETTSTLKKIRHFYNEHSNFSDVQLFKNNDYYVYKHNNEIVAGVQVFDIHWKIEAMPGIKGKIAVKVLPYVPIVRKIINPKNYHFLATEGVFCLNGHEDKIEILLESVLALKRKNSMLFWADNKDEKLLRIIQKINLGLLQKMKSDNDIEILARFNNYDEHLKDAIKSSPKYISAFDAT
jgi:hypothetical protein